jgi:putative redox protein
VGGASEVIESRVEFRGGAGVAFQGTSSNGLAVPLDASPEAGGAGEGLRPVELLLLGLGGCTGIDVLEILRKMRQDVTGYEVRVRGARRAEHPRIFTHITVEHIVRGRAVKPGAVRRAVELSATRYCSVSGLLRRAASLEERYRIVDAATGAEVVGTLAPGAA